MEIFVVIVFALIVLSGLSIPVGFVLLAVYLIKREKDNEKLPLVRVKAKVLLKRTDMNVSGGGNSNFGVHSYNWYYVTFELENGERREFSISGKEYGLLCEGDCGILAYRGRRYISFNVVKN